MMNKLILILTLALATINVNAQNFLNDLRKQEAGKGTVTITQAAEIDSLVNGTRKHVQQTNAAQQHGSNTPNNAHHNDVANNHDNSTPTSTVNNTSSPTPSADTETVIDTRKKVMRNSYKMQGYRIQAFSGGNTRVDKHKAESTGAVLKANFPNEPIYVHFYNPSWKCRMGNYKTIEEAREPLAKVKKLGFPQACIIKGPINVQY